MDFGDQFKLLFLGLMCAGYVLLALLLFARTLSSLGSYLRAGWQRVWAAAHADRPCRRAGEVSGAGTQGMTGGGASASPRVPASVYARQPRARAGVKAQATKSGGRGARAA